MLIEAGSKAIDTPDNNGRLPIHYAAENGHVVAIETLIKLGSQALDSPDLMGHTPMSLAAEKGQCSVIAALVRLGSQAIDTPDHEGRTPVYRAASKKQEEAIEMLVQMGSQAIDTPDAHLRTPLHYAVQFGHVKVIETLVRLGSKAIDKPSRYKWTPMHSAAKEGNDEVIDTLVRLGSTAIDTPNMYGWTAMHIAAWNGHANVIETLLRLGSAALESTDKEGMTPLTAAISSNSNEAIACLVRSGADLALGFLEDDYESLDGSWTKQSEPAAVRLGRYYDLETRSLKFTGANLSNEEAAALPLSSWKSVLALDFRGNPNLTQIPVSLALLNPDHITNITFDPPTAQWGVLEANIIESSGDPLVIIEYAKLKADGESVPVDERKLMVIGPSMAGKTTLIRRLRDENHSHPAPTDGVDMVEVTLHPQNGEPLRMLVWDFAGNPLYQHTHLLFLRNPGLCLLMFRLTDDVGTSVERLRFWCDTLSSFAPDSGSHVRVLLVGTHLDRCTDPLQAQQLASQVWQRLQAILPISDQPVLISCADGIENRKTIATLCSTILRVSQAMDVRAPACIEVARQALLAESTTTNVPMLTSDAAHELLIKHAKQASNGRLDISRLVTDAQVRDTCIRGLHMLGSVVLLEHRRKITHVVVNPQWAALLMASVVTARHSWIKRGQVTFKILSSQIWGANSRFPIETHRMLVSVLEQLKIMSVVSHSRPQLFLIPCLLPEQRPSNRFGGMPCIAANREIRLRRLVQLKTASRRVPISLLPELIVQMMGQAQAQLMEAWQQGAVFRIRSAVGEVVLVSMCTMSKHVGVEVMVQSQSVQESAEWIRDTSAMVENLLSEVYHLDFEVRVPCSSLDSDDNTDDDSCYFLLDNLRYQVCQRKRISCRPAGCHVARVDLIAPDLLFADEGYQSFVRQWSEFEMATQLGQAAPGKVMTARHCNPAASPTAASSTATDGHLIAIKLLESEGVGSKELRAFQHEAYSMSLQHHPNIVRFVGVCFPADHPQADYDRQPAMLMEALDGGTLYESLTDSVAVSKARIAQLQQLQQQLNTQLEAYFSGLVTAKLHTDTAQTIAALGEAARIGEFALPMEWPMRLKLATDLAQAMMLLHSLSPPMVHRGFNSSNVFLTRRLHTVDLTTIDWSLPLAKVGDFGLSICTEAGNAPLQISDVSTWAAPEVFAKQHYSTETDVYAFSILLWELLTREHPFADVPREELPARVMGGARPTVPDTFFNDSEKITQDYVVLMQECWHQDPDKRPIISAVYSELRSLCQRVAPAVFSTLPDVVPTTRSKQKSLTEHKIVGTQRIRAEDVDSMVGVVCMALVDDTTIWLGLSSGNVLVVQLTHGATNHSVSAMNWTRSFATDRHLKGVTALSYNAYQHLTMWSGSKDGYLHVWKADVETIEQAKARCFMKSRFTIVDSNFSKLARFKGRPLECVLRNGVLQFYPDENAGPPCLEFDLCHSDMVAQTDAAKKVLELVGQARRLLLKPVDVRVDETEENFLPDWQRTITYLAQLARAGRGLSRLAAAPPSSSTECITALESTEEATWCLTFTTLVEWHLIEQISPEQVQFRMEPGRQLTFDMECEQFSDPRLRSVCGVVWVAPDVLWVGAANTPASVDLLLSSTKNGLPGSSLSSNDARCSTADLLAQNASPSRKSTRLSDCPECQRPFGMFRHRHPCQRCFLTFCSDCLPASRLCLKCRRNSHHPQPLQQAGLHAARPKAIELQWPSADSPRHKDAIRLLLLVEYSQLNYEVWTYAQGEDILVWMPPHSSRRSSNQSPRERSTGPVLLDRVPVGPELPVLICLKQVGDQVWAGTRLGTIVGWDIATRTMLPRSPLPTEFQHEHTETGSSRPTTDMSVHYNKKKCKGFVISAGLEPSLRKIILAPAQT